jgi:DNA-binding NtrC family response regulator
MNTSEAVKIFTIEDDPAYSKFLEYILSLNPDFVVKQFLSGSEALECLHERPSIITLDYTMPELSGEQVLRQIKDFDPNIHVIIVSGQEKIGTAVDLLKLGAYDYITKDDNTKDRLLTAIQNIRKNVNLIREIDHLKEEISTKYDFEKSIIGTSPAIKGLFKLMEKAINTNITVSVYGETGTGKDLVAKAIHYNSKRKKKPFIAVNIAAIPKDLMESELFGHEKGSFTGAMARRIGKFEEAQQGTIFLDEIGELDLNLQTKLLRVLQEKEVTRVGSNEVIPLEVRVIVATHKDLAEEVKKGKFREDLYYRLLGLPINIPPLRERGNDTIVLARHFLKEFCQENDMPKKSFSNESKDKLMGYGYPGNVRELKSIVELAAVMSDGDFIEGEEISFTNISNENALMIKEMTLKDYTYSIIKHFLNKYDDNVLLVADKLDIGKSSIYRYLKEMENLQEN